MPPGAAPCPDPQVEQARRVKARYPGMPTVVYVAADGASPLYDAMLPLFQDWERYKGFFYLNSDGTPYKPHYKCAIGTTHSGAPNGVKAAGCMDVRWNFYNASARESVKTAGKIRHGCGFIVLGYVSVSTRAPHGVYVWRTHTTPIQPASNLAVSGSDRHST